MVVEDDRTTRQALQALLESNDYQVLMASTGVEALKNFEAAEENIVLVVSDVVMPEMGGVALYAALQERDPDIKMLLITGHPLEEANQALLETGSVHWLQKPFSVADINQALRVLLTEPLEH
jgi:CheY-like chemotaxis protein